MSRHDPMTLDVRPARPGDEDGIVRVIRSGFSAAELDLMIFGCGGIERFVALQIEQADLARSSYYTVAADETGRIVGCAELRHVRGAVFLNYISVAPTHQGRGVGRQLLRAALDERDWRTDVFRLDVFEHNTPALSWYERLGLVRDRAFAWLSLPPGEGGAAPDTYVSGFPQAEICHQAFGFSQFSLTTRLGAYEIGRLGDGWFRISDIAGTVDPALVPALAHLEPRRLLVVVESELVTGDLVGRGELLLRTFLMSAPLETVRRALR